MIPGRDTIQLPADGAGKQLDAYAYQFYDPVTATTVTRYAQAAVLVDSSGDLLSNNGSMEVQDSPVRVLLEKILMEMRLQNEQLARLTGVATAEPADTRGL